MIFGTSRSAQGIVPNVLSEQSNDSDLWFNFSFNLGDSPWNRGYAEAIVKKLNCSILNQNNGIFLFFIDPWSVDSLSGLGSNSLFFDSWVDPCNINLARYCFEKTSPLDVIGGGHRLTFPKVLHRLLRFNTRGHNPVNSDGYFCNVNQISSQERVMRIKQKLKSYSEKKLHTSWPGKPNMEALSSTIRSVQQNFPSSRIILVRPHVAADMLKLERQEFPAADSVFRNFANSQKVEFLDLNGDQYVFLDTLLLDAHHFTESGSIAQTRIIGEYLYKERELK